MRWVGQNLSSKHYKFLSRQNTTVRYTDIIKSKESRRYFIYSKSYYISIFELTKKPEKSFALQELITTAYTDYMDNATNVLSPSCPASAWALQILAPQLSICVAKPYWLHLLQLLPECAWKVWTSADPVVGDCLPHLLQLTHEPRDINECIFHFWNSFGVLCFSEFTGETRLNTCCSYFSG